MSPAALGQAIAAAAGIAISPVSIATVILLLLSARARAAGVGFLVGWSLGIVAAVTVFTLISSGVSIRVPVAVGATLAVIQLTVGLLLLVFAVVSWRRRRRADVDEPHPPAWMRAADRVTFPIAFAVGLAMAANPPNLLLSLAGGVSIAMTGAAGVEIVLIVVLFALLATSTVLIPVVGHVIAADALQRPFIRVREWLTRHSSEILTAVFVALGLLSLCQGAWALSTG